MLSNLSPACGRSVITALIIVLRVVAWVVIAACGVVLALNLAGMYLLATGQAQPGDILLMDEIATSMPEYWWSVKTIALVIITMILIESLGVSLLRRLRARVISHSSGSR